MAQFFILTGLWTVNKQLLETLNRQLTFMLRPALIDPIYVFIHSLQWATILKHISLTLFMFWHISHLNAQKRDIYFAVWTLYFLFNALTIFLECNIQDSPRSKDGLLIVFRGFNIGMLIIHALIIHACYKFKKWYAETGSLADDFASSDRRITSYDVLYTLWPFILPGTWKTQVFVLASFASNILSSYLHTLSISINHQKYLDAVPYTRNVIYEHIISLLGNNFAKLHYELLNRANSHDSNVLKGRIYSHIMHLSAEFHNKKQWQVISAALDEGNTIIIYIRNAVFKTITYILDLILGIYYLLRAFSINGACIVFITTLVYPLLGQAFDTGTRAEIAYKATKEVKRVREDSIKGWQDLALLDLIPFAERRLKRLLERSSELLDQSTRQVQIKSAVQELFTTTISASSELYLIYRIQHQEASKTDLVMFATYWLKISNSLTFLSTLSHDVRQRLIAAKDAVTILRTKPTVEDLPDAVPLETFKGTIEFKHVDFAYNEGEPVLQDLSFCIEANEVVAFVGLSGSGKSTIVLLLMRFYNPDKGSILLDKQDIRNFTIQSVRNHFSVVLQSTFVYNGNILDNVKCGDEKASDEQVINACQIAGLGSDISAFTQGYNTIIGEQGQSVESYHASINSTYMLLLTCCLRNLSGGQTQRIAIARAILRGSNKSGFILDEFTSALDSITTQRIMQYVHKLEATKLIITHNLKIAADTRRIILIEKGRAVADGSHSELLRSSESYRAHWNGHVGDHLPDAPGRQDAPECYRTA